MSIFPIVTGQTPDSTNPIPPRSTAATDDTSKSAPEGTPDSKEPQDDLIDFGQNEAPAEAPPPQTPDEIEKMLAATGKPAQGPLIDFAQDLRKDMPTTNP